MSTRTRCLHGLAGSAFLLLLLSGLAIADDVADCNQPQDLDRRILGCTALTKLPELAAPERAIVLQLRGNAFRLKKEFERALADYNEAMVLTTDSQVRKQAASGIMLSLTEAPPALRRTAAGRRAIELMERNFQQTKAGKPPAK